MPKSYVYGGRSPDHANAHLYSPGGLGTLGALVPTTGDGGLAGILAENVALNGWQGVEVRCFIVSSNFPQLKIYPDSSYIAGGLANALYQATLRVYADGVDQGTMLFELLVGGETIIATAQLQDVGSEQVVCNVDIAPAPETLAVQATLQDVGTEQLQCVVNIFDGSSVPPTLAATGSRRIKAGTRTPVKLDPLDVAEVDDLVLTYATLDLADPIVTVDMSVQARVGTDPQGAPLLVGQYQVTQLGGVHTVLQRVHGERGIAGVTYLVRATARTVSGRSSTASAFVKVLRKL